MIGSIVDITILSKSTMLQMGLGLLAQSKDVIEHLHDYVAYETFTHVYMIMKPVTLKLLQQLTIENL